MTQDLLEKIVLDDATIQERIATVPGPVMFTNDVFDILHRGHVGYLQAARDLGGSLVLGLNSDVPVHQLSKEPCRPLNAELDRAFLLAGPVSVSLIDFFDERRPVSLLHRVYGDISVKDGDYDMESLEETAVVRSQGGGSLAIQFVNGYLTTSLVRLIRSEVA